MQRMKHTTELIGALVLLAIAGSFAALAAPRPQTPHASAQMAPTSTPLTLAAAVKATATMAPTSTPKSTTRAASSPRIVSASTTNPTPTPTPAPTSTPTSAPTATTAPSWHTLGSYSGSTASTLGTITMTGLVRVEYTCQAGYGVNFSFADANGGQFAMSTQVCMSSTTSGTLTSGQIDNGNAVTLTVSVVAYDSNGTGAWTATISDYN